MVGNFMKIEDLKGMSFQNIIVDKRENEIRFISQPDAYGIVTTYLMYHAQNCCESVYIEDIVGNIDDLLNTPFVEVYEAVNQNECLNCEASDEDSIDYEDSRTWTFYHFRTIKGTVTIRWKGVSNGYYSESVDFIIKSQDAMPFKGGRYGTTRFTIQDYIEEA